MYKKNIKQTRINNEVKKTLALIIDNELQDERVSPFTSVMDVQVTQDLKFCKAIISVLGNEEEIASTKEGLESAKGFIRSRLAKIINLRNTPEITFIMSNSIDYAIKMSSMIDEVIKRDESNKRD